MVRLAIFLFAVAAVTAVGNAQRSCSYQGRVLQDGETLTESGRPTGSDCTLVNCTGGEIQLTSCPPIDRNCELGGDPDADYPICCPTSNCSEPPGQCFSQVLGRYLQDLEVATEPGCVKAECFYGFLVRSRCPEIPRYPGCVEKKGNSTADPPGCCPTSNCSEGVCYSYVVNKLLLDEETVTEPNCIEARCISGTLLRYACPEIQLGPGCVEVKGNPDGDQPDCCPTAKCPSPGQCFSQELGRILQDGETSTEPGCIKANCTGGEVLRNHCGKIELGPGCVEVKGNPDADYPGCCPSANCSGPLGQCFSQSLNRTLDNGEVVTEPECEQVQCHNGITIRSLCKAYSDRIPLNCSKVDGTPGAPFPKCCNDTICQ